MTIKTFIGTACLLTMLQMQAANANQSGLREKIAAETKVQSISSGVPPVYVDADGVGNY